MNLDSECGRQSTKTIWLVKIMINIRAYCTCFPHRNFLRRINYWTRLRASLHVHVYCVLMLLFYLDRTPFSASVQQKRQVTAPWEKDCQKALVRYRHLFRCCLFDLQHTIFCKNVVFLGWGWMFLTTLRISASNVQKMFLNIIVCIWVCSCIFHSYKPTL